MKIVILSGGSGIRLWPLSNSVRSKQFLRLLPSPSDEKESMIQRITRQIRCYLNCNDITIVTNRSQKETLINQLNNTVNIITEPCRRDTFPAICLATGYLALKDKTHRDEVVVVIPSDMYTDEAYYKAIKKMVKLVKDGESDLALMGIKPKAPTSKFGYIIPSERICKDDYYAVNSFKEKPTEEVAKKLITFGALWNCGVFACKLGYLLNKLSEYITINTYDNLLTDFTILPKTSFDYEIVEKAKSVAVVPCECNWNDLGTWDSLLNEIGQESLGHVIGHETCTNTHIINNLDIPVASLGLKDVIVVAAPDGILVSDLTMSYKIKDYSSYINEFPKFVECSWGNYTVIDCSKFDNNKSVTLKGFINVGKTFKCLSATASKATITIINGKGTISNGNEFETVTTGDSFDINSYGACDLTATTDIEAIITLVGDKLEFNDFIF